MIKSYTGTHGMIVAITPIPIANDYIGKVVEGIIHHANLLGYTIEVSVQHPDYENVLPYLLSREDCKGAVAIVPLNHDEVTTLCTQYQKPYVLIDYPNKDILHIPSVEVNNYEGIKNVMQHLGQLGHKRIGFITGRMLHKSAQYRLQAYQDFLTEVGIPLDPALVGEGDWEHPAAFKQGIRLLRLNNPPTAIVGSNDLSAFGAMQAAEEMGLVVGKDISITGFDDIPEAAEMNPPLTTVRQPMEQLGSKALEMLVKHLSGEPLPELHVIMPTELIIRASTGRAPS